MYVIYQNKRNIDQSAFWSEITLHNYFVLLYLAVVVMTSEDKTHSARVGENKSNWW